MSFSLNLETFFFLKKDFLEKDSEREEMDGRDGTREDTEDTTRLVEMEELKRVIRALLFVTKLSRVDSHKDKADLAEVDNWDLRDHRREGTRVQTCHNVQVRSRINQQQPRISW